VVADRGSAGPTVLSVSADKIVNDKFINSDVCFPSDKNNSDVFFLLFFERSYKIFIW